MLSALPPSRFTFPPGRRNVAVDTPHDPPTLIGFGIRASDAACQPAGARFREPGGIMTSLKLSLVTIAFLVAVAIPVVLLVSRWLDAAGNALS